MVFEYIKDPSKFSNDKTYFWFKSGEEIYEINVLSDKSIKASIWLESYELDYQKLFVKSPDFLYHLNLNFADSATTKKIMRDLKRTYGYVEL